MSFPQNIGHPRPPFPADLVNQKNTLILRLAHISAFITWNLSPSPNLVELDNLLHEVENKARSLFLATAPVNGPRQPGNPQVFGSGNEPYTMTGFPVPQSSAGHQPAAAPKPPIGVLPPMNTPKFGQEQLLQPGLTRPSAALPFRPATLNINQSVKRDPLPEDGLCGQERNGKALEDYQLQLMLLERQNRRRLAMAKMELTKDDPALDRSSVKTNDPQSTPDDSTEARAPELYKEQARQSEETGCPKSLLSQKCENVRQARRQEIRARRLEKLEKEGSELQSVANGEDTEKDGRSHRGSSDINSTSVNQVGSFPRHTTSEPKTSIPTISLRPPPDRDVLGQACLSLSRLSHKLPEESRSGGAKASCWDACLSPQHALKAAIDDILHEVQILRSRKLTLACRYRKDLHGRSDAVKYVVKHLNALEALNLVTIARICQSYFNAPAREADKEWIGDKVLPLAQEAVKRLREWKEAFDKVEKALDEAETTRTAPKSRDDCRKQPVEEEISESEPEMESELEPESEPESERSSIVLVDEDDFLVVNDG